MFGFKNIKNINFKNKYVVDIPEHVSVQVFGCDNIHIFFLNDITFKNM